MLRMHKFINDDRPSFCLYYLSFAMMNENTTDLIDERSIKDSHDNFDCNCNEMILVKRVRNYVLKASKFVDEC